MKVTIRLGLLQQVVNKCGNGGYNNRTVDINTETIINNNKSRIRYLIDGYSKLKTNQVSV